MDYDYVDRLKKSHPALKLLAADNGPLIISFLFKVFIEPNVRALPISELQSRLADYIFNIREIHGEELYPRSAGVYLDEWANPERGILRKFYPRDQDEPEYDLTPAAAQAIDWLQGLADQHFVGTESRLLTVFDLLTDIVRRTETDPETKIQELEARKEALEQEIEQIRNHGILPHDPVQVKERVFQAEETARHLLADFRQIEYNFRTLDRETRERIATSDRAKGVLLDEIFAEQDMIRDSDQGRSFQAFWELLMSPAKQLELQELLQRVYELDEINDLEPDQFLARIKFYLLEAGEKVYTTGNQLVEQLRRFLDNQAWLENRRIMDIIKEIEKNSIEIKNNPPSDKFIPLDTIKLRLDLAMDRSLFTPPKQVELTKTNLEEGLADIKTDALFNQVHVDEELLRGNIRKALQSRTQISLKSLLTEFPLEKGLAELVAYVNISTKIPTAMVAESKMEDIIVAGRDGIRQTIQLEQIIFVR